MTLEKEFEQFIDRLGLSYFKGREFTPYWSRVVNGVKNSCPPESIWPKIVRTIIVLDKLRGRLGYSINLTSTYRSPAYNRAVGGEPNSFHMRFMAIDFQGSSGKPSQWHEKLKDMRGQGFDLPGNEGRFLFRGGIGMYPTFVHVDTRGYDANW